MRIMDKINTNSEVVNGPLKSSKKYPNILMMSVNKNVYFADHQIIPRIQKYLEANLNSHYIDINNLADELQRRYPKDYAKRKKSAFRSMIKKAYGVIMQNYGANPSGSNSEEVSSDSEAADRGFGDNSLNNQLLQLYGRKTQPKPLEDNELIAISSDDSADHSDMVKNSNGPSSSNNFMEGHFMESILPKAPIISQNIPPQIQEKQENVNSKPVKKRKTDNSHINAFAKRRKGPIGEALESKYTFKDIGGLDKVLEEICQLLVHVKHPEVYRQIGISPPRGFLLHGPPGCGKTLLANCIAGELEIPLLKISAPELVAGVSGESEERIRELFETATLSSPCILFIDEIDAITPNRQFAQKDMERRIVAQLLTCLDDLSKNENGDKVVVIGATNRPDALDPALRRAGRFDREVSLGIPDVPSRLHILKVLTSKLRLEEDFNFETLAKFTPGFVGADLMSLTREAALTAVNRVFNEIKEKRKLEEAIALQQKSGVPLVPPPPPEISKNEAEIVVDGDETTTPSSKPIEVEEPTSNSVVVIDDDAFKKHTQSNVINSTSIPEPPPRELTRLEELIGWLHNQAPLTTEQLDVLFVTGEDFAKALKHVQPSAKREGFATVPDVTWDDIGSLSEIREELQLTILAPVRHSEQFKSLGITAPTGVLLCGPPGCGKTLLAKAIANEAGINFISVKGPELLNMYVGESERAVRVCFERARNSAPCVIFFDELDALCPKRSDSREGGPTMRIVNQMLTEMDGVESRQGVYLLAASNRPDIIDPAVLRPGRLDKILYVGLPTAQERADIMRTLTKNGTRPLLAPEVNLELIGKSEECEGYTGADLAALVREAGILALREMILLGDVSKPPVVTNEHFTKAVSKIRPSVSEKDKQHYAKLKKIYSAKQQEVEEMEYS